MFLISSSECFRIEMSHLNYRLPRGHKADTRRHFGNFQSTTSFNAPLSGAGTVNTGIYVAPRGAFNSSNKRKSLPYDFAMPR